MDRERRVSREERVGGEWVRRMGGEWRRSSEVSGQESCCSDDTVCGGESDEVGRVERVRLSRKGGGLERAREAWKDCGIRAD
jgi:hypothetical protein